MKIEVAVSLIIIDSIKRYTYICAVDSDEHVIDTIAFFLRIPDCVCC